MLFRSRSLVIALVIPGALVATGCMKAKPKPENRTPLTTAMNGSGSGIEKSSFTPTTWDATGGAPGEGGFGASGTMAPGSGSGFGADGSATGTGTGSLDSATGDLMNTASTAGVDSGLFVSELEMVHFEFDSDQISPDWAAVLDRHATWINGNGKVMVQVEGHCDDRGTEEYNTSLGQRRADTVRTYLSQKGVDANRLSTISYGELRPLNFDATEEAHALNRRAMFLVYETDNTVASAPAGF